jgi:hypothetical protein
MTAAVSPSSFPQSSQLEDEHRHECGVIGLTERHLPMA